MLGLIQRVSAAKVVIDAEVTASIGTGLLLLLGIQKGDTRVDKLLHKVVNYRVFDAPDQRRMNLSLLDVAGELLIVPQFTLAADTGKGLRPSFSSAAAPKDAERLYDAFVEAAGKLVSVATGRFGADMQVSLVNDGPVTFLLRG